LRLDGWAWVGAELGVGMGRHVQVVVVVVGGGEAGRAESRAVVG
jgi:hypothetical protein